MRKHTLSIFQMLFAGACQAHKNNNDLVFQVLALLWNELPTVCMCISDRYRRYIYVWQIIGWDWANMAASHITQVTTILWQI